MSRNPSRIKSAVPATLPLLAAVLAAGVQAEEAQAADTASGTLQKVVVSAAGFEQKITDAPASVTVVGREELESKPYTSLADALRDIEGIDVGSGFDKNGNISITLRGLPPEYTLILFDGRRQSDVGNIGPNNFGNSQFMYMPPLAAIERIEVVRGPMSTLYGADAMGGVINIITRKVAKNWGGSISTGMTLQQNSQFGDDRKTDIYVSGPIVSDVLGLTLRGGIYDRDASNPGYSQLLPTPPAGDPNLVYSDDAGFGDKKIVAAQNWNLGATLSLVPVAGHELTLAHDVAKQRYDNTTGQTGTLDSVESLWRVRSGIVQPRVGYTPYQRVEREQTAFTYNGDFSFGQWENAITHLQSRNLGRSQPLTVQERNDLQTIWDQAVIDQGVSNPALTDAIRDQLSAQFLPRPQRILENRSLIVDSVLDTAIGDSHALTVGMQYWDVEMEDGVFGMFGGGYQKGTVQKHRQIAVFAEDHWAMTDSLTMTVGTRYDDHNIYGGNNSPRLYLTWAADSNWTVKGGISTGYKTPRPDQLFDGIVGFGGQGTMPLVGTPDLEPETSTNYEVAAYFDNQQGASINVTLFFNDFKDKIARTDNVPNCYDNTGTQVLFASCVDIGPGWAELGYTTFTQYTNIDKVETYGMELAGSYAFTRSLRLRGNYTYTESEQKSGANKGDPLVNTPKNMLNATLSWQANNRLELSFITEARDKRYRGEVANEGGKYYKAYELFHLGARYQANEHVVLNARINNLLDDDLSGRSCALNDAQDDYNCWSDYSTTERGRSIWLSTDVTF